MTGGTEVELVGRLSDGREVRRHSIGSEDGVLLRLLDLGAAVQEMWVPDASGRRANVVLGSSRVVDYARTPSDYLGAVVGRVANRIDGASFELDGVRYPLPANDGEHHLHGGPSGFHARTWTPTDLGADHVRFELVSPDGDQGYPGELHVAVTYRVVGLTVDVVFEATTTTATPVSLTQHSHINLGGEGSGTVDRHELTVAASRYTPVGAGLIPSGALESVDGTPLDLRRPRVIGEVVRAAHPQLLLGRGLDLNLVLDPDAEWSAVLADPVSGRRLRLWTDRPGLQVYSGNFFDGRLVGTSGRTYRQGDGVALEPQGFPDAVHHEDWPSVVVTPDAPYRSALRWDLEPGGSGR